MQICLNKRTALYLIRLRRHTGTHRLPTARADLVPPDPAPAKRWTKRVFQTITPSLPSFPVDVAVPSAASRIKSVCANNTVYRQELPANAFVDLGGGVRIASPELVFAEMATAMAPVVHLMLGLELCGTFARDPLDPRNGPVSFFVPAVTSAERLTEFLKGMSGVTGVERARQTLSWLSNNAWSPTEALIAAMASLPIYRMGYDCKNVVLNRRVAVGTTASRVPDILFGDTKIGINYDGTEHLDLDAIENAARVAATNPKDKHAQRALGDIKRGVRRKAVDDIRRNRDLGSEGYVVFPATKEDLYENGGLDRLMTQVFEAMGHFADDDAQERLKWFVNPRMRERRQQLIWALLPGPQGDAYKNLLMPE